MTVIEMIHSFWLKAKTLDETGADSVKSFDVVTLLNNAQDIVIDELVSNRAWQYVRPITTSFVFTDISTPDFTDSYSHGIGYVQADGTRTCDMLEVGTADPYHTYRNYIRSQSKISRTAVPQLTDERVSNEDITQEFIHEIETSGTNVPMFTNPKALLEGGKLVVIGDGYTTMSEVTVVFVRVPTVLDPTVTTVWANGVRGVSTTCELPTELHQRIVDVAVGIFYSQVNVGAAQLAKQKLAAK
jgi:hypothetical protein